MIKPQIIQPYNPHSIKKPVHNANLNEGYAKENSGNNLPWRGKEFIPTFFTTLHERFNDQYKYIIQQIGILEEISSYLHMYHPHNRILEFYLLRNRLVLCIHNKKTVIINGMINDVEQYNQIIWYSKGRF